MIVVSAIGQIGHEVVAVSVIDGLRVMPIGRGHSEMPALRQESVGVPQSSVGQDKMPSAEHAPNRDQRRNRSIASRRVLTS